MPKNKEKELQQQIAESELRLGRVRFGIPVNGQVSVYETDISTLTMLQRIAEENVKKSQRKFQKLVNSGTIVRIAPYDAEELRSKFSVIQNWAEEWRGLCPFLGMFRPWIGKKANT